MSEILQRAKAIQAKTANETQLWIRLDLLEGLIDEIEALEHRVDALSQHHLKPVRERAEARQKEG